MSSRYLVQHDRGWVDMGDVSAISERATDRSDVQRFELAVAGVAVLVDIPSPKADEFLDTWFLARVPRDWAFLPGEWLAGERVSVRIDLPGGMGYELFLEAGMPKDAIAERVGHAIEHIATVYGGGRASLRVLEIELTEYALGEWARIKEEKVQS